MSKLRSLFTLTIGTKLVGLIALLLMGSIMGVVFVATRMFTDDNTALIQQMNSDTAASLSTQMRELLETTTEKMRVLGTVLMQEYSVPGAKDTVVREFFAKDKDLVAVYLNKHEEDGNSSILQRALSPEMANLNDPQGDQAFGSLAEDKDFSLKQLSNGEVLVSTAKLADGSPAVAVAIPFIQSPTKPGFFTHSLVALIKQSRFVKAFSESDIVTSFLVDRKGKLLAHPEASRFGENVAYLGVVKQLLEGKFNNGQSRYINSQNNEARLGAFRVVGFGGLGVVAEVAEAKAFEAAKRVQYRAILVAVGTLCIAFLLGYLFSGTITWPIKQLVVAAQRIKAGDFAINLKAKGRDEVAQLSGAFNEMAAGLEERDRVKETFNKFHNKEIAEKLLSGEVKLGGERKNAVIFFSDVRGFTAMSETMEPEQVVEMLNEYMTRMVAIIRAHHGIVDKYVGDAIMAIWGVPLGSPDDAENAVKACLAMRMELAALNELRISRGQHALKIGMGLNMGSVIAGNIGSNEKMEYTVIGDSVNLASRMESMTKEYGTDFLLPRSVHDAVQGKFVFQQGKSAKVKGKTQAIEVYMVKGYIDEQGQQVILETPYSTYESEKSDKVVHDDHGEQKAEEHHEVEATHNIVADRTGMVQRPVPAAPVTAVPAAPAAVAAAKPVSAAMAAVLGMPAAEPAAEAETADLGDDLIDAPPVQESPSRLLPAAPDAEPSKLIELPVRGKASAEAPLDAVPEPMAAPEPVFAVEPVAVESAAPADILAPMLAMPFASPPAPEVAAEPVATMPPLPAAAPPPTFKHESPVVAPTGEKSWYLDVYGQTMGPFSREEIIDGLRNAAFALDSSMSETGQSPWFPLSDVPEFQQVVTEIQAMQQKAA